MTKNEAKKFIENLPSEEEIEADMQAGEQQAENAWLIYSESAEDY